MKVFKVAKFELKKIFRNHWLVIILFLGSIFVVSLFGFVANHSPENVPLGIYKVRENELTNEITANISDSKVFNIQNIQNIDEGRALIKDDKIKGFTVIDLLKTNYYQGEIRIIDDIRYPEIQAVIREEILERTKDNLAKNIQSIINLNQSGLNLEPIKLEAEENIGKEIKYFDRFASGVIVLVLVLICLQLTAISISHERESGTFERLSTKPLSGHNIILGKFLANSLIGIIATILVTFSFWIFFKIALGNLFLVFLVESLVALIAVAIGILISVITYNVATSIQVSFYAFFAFVITSQLFWTKENVHQSVKGLIALSPFTYAVEALKKINLYDWGWREIRMDILYLLVFLALFSILSILLLKREIK